MQWKGRSWILFFFLYFSFLYHSQLCFHLLPFLSLHTQDQGKSRIFSHPLVMEHCSFQGKKILCSFGKLLSYLVTSSVGVRLGSHCMVGIMQGGIEAHCGALDPFKVPSKSGFLTKFYHLSNGRLKDLNYSVVPSELRQSISVKTEISRASPGFSSSGLQ